jgi:hypothetical protein
MKKTLTIILVLACLTAAAQSMFYQSTVARVCTYDDYHEEILECRDGENSTIFEVGDNLDYIRIIPAQGESATYRIFDVETNQEGDEFAFYTIMYGSNARYDFLLDFTGRTMYIRDLSDNNHGYLFYYSKSWQK